MDSTIAHHKFSRAYSLTGSELHR